MRRFAITIALACRLGTRRAGRRARTDESQPPASRSEAGGPSRSGSRRSQQRPRPRRPTRTRRAVSFEPTEREFLIGGRFTSVDGDPARYQRYQDQRDGLLFSNFRYSFAKPDGTWDFHARAENVGYRDQEFMGSYDRIGQLSLNGSWQQIPQFYSVDTMTPYTGSGGTLVLDDATQRAIQNGQANLNAYVPLAPQFDLRERRDIGRVDVVATPKPNLDVTASFTTQKHGGELPWGASFGFSNDVEVPLPVRFAHERPHHRHRMDERAQHAACRLQRLVVRQHRADAGLGQPAPARRRVRRTRDADACRSGRRTRPRPSASAATPSWRTRRR